jgi:putative acetyltransferase
MDNLASRYHIRHYSQMDMPAVLHVFKRSIYKIGSLYYNPQQIDAWAAASLDLHAWEQRLNSGVVLVATFEKTLTGFIRFEPTGKIDLLYVHPNYQHQGIAKALLHKVERLAEQQRIPRLFAMASEASKEFFTSQGYAFIASQEVEKRGGIKLLNHRMEKTISVAA